jgi:hypothetical protein
MVVLISMAPGKSHSADRSIKSVPLTMSEIQKYENFLHHANYPELYVEGGKREFSTGSKDASSTVTVECLSDKGNKVFVKLGVTPKETKIISAYTMTKPKNDWWKTIRNWLGVY